EIQSARRYRHQALNTSTQQIRLIKLHLRNTNRPEFDMSVFELSNAPPFTTLSYMWGPPSPRFDITISGKPLGIRENLFRFFETYVRNTENDFLWEYTGPLYLWIDQICIDQSSVSERNHQVGMMASIYSECSKTIIWLGIIPNNPDAPRMIKKMESSSVPEESVIQAVASIIRHDYFTRLWIVQEVILSKWKRVLCSHPSAGAVWVDWDNLAYIARRFQYRLPSTPAKHLVKDHLQEIGLNLVQAVRFFSQGRCHDPRDKVYGLMGLVREEQRLTIDYAKPLEELLADM
ncbi:heterokaryon incompatibility protein-domain-containing protein, partial [Alternaria rosae]|uniref:heterokaryon incompatibility protein-domain-containing protein n=1 Tax=Alternaria rosae TaxID=1187941 RepID=UPI001E8CC3E0